LTILNDQTMTSFLPIPYDHDVTVTMFLYLLYLSLPGSF